MGRHKDGRRADLQADLQQVAGIQPQDGPSVRGEIADAFQTAGKPVRIFQRGHEDEVMHLAHLAVPLVDGTDLRLEDEARFGVVQQTTLPLQKVGGLRLSLPQAVEPAVRILHELFTQLLPPLGMREIPRAQHIDALAAGPGRQMGGRELFAGGA